MLIEERISLVVLCSVLVHLEFKLSISGLLIFLLFGQEQILFHHRLGHSSSLGMVIALCFGQHLMNLGILGLILSHEESSPRFA